MSLDVAGIVAGITVSQPTDAEVDTWARVDLAPYLDGTRRECVPTILTRDDGVGLFYAGRVNGIHGDSGIGKTWVAVAAAAQELLAGRRVGWLHYEDPDPGLVVSRLQGFGVPGDVIVDHLDYRQPADPITEDALARLDVELVGCALIVVDSLGEVFGVEGITENEDREVAEWMRKVARRLERTTGAAILILDHSTKAADGSLHPSGSKRKRAAITGASYLVEAPVPLTKERGGRIRLTTAKDRHGTHGRGSEAGTLEVSVYPDEGMTFHVWPASITAKDAPDARMRRIARAAVDAAAALGRPASQRELIQRMDVRASADAKRAGIEHAVAEGALRVEEGPRRALLHIYVQPLPEQDT